MYVKLESFKSLEKDKIRQIVVFVLVVLVGLMVPIWLNLSKVYRSSLKDIPLDVYSLTVGFRVYIAMHNLSFNSPPPDAMIYDVNNKLAQHMNSISSDRNITFSPYLHKLDPEDASDKSGSYFVNVKCSNENSVTMHPERTIDIVVEICTSDFISKTLTSVLSGIFAPECKIWGFTKSAGTEQTDNSALKYSSEYQLIFTLLVGNPNDAAVSWDSSLSIEAIRPLLRQLSNLTHFAVSSQIQNYAALTQEPAKRDINGRSMYTLSPKDLTLFINSAEWNLESSISSSPKVNFLLYIPPRKFSPLQILQSEKHPLATNAFLIPQWGGILIENMGGHDQVIVNGSGRIHLQYPRDLHGAMEIYASQLRTLLGVHDFEISGDYAKELDKFKINILPHASKGISDWELDNLLRRRTLYNIRDAISTLQSLGSLLKSQESIVVEDHIASLVDASILAIEKAKMYLGHCKYNEAAQFARIAIVNAEKAFFDPTMVSLLYFPDQHLLAIYMPFFVPIAVPMLAAVVKEWKIWRAGSLQQKVKTE